MSIRSNMISGLALAAAAAVAFTAGSASSQSFGGKTIKIVIPYGPGGTYDKYGQTFARHLDKHIPGKPTVIVQHMPGAGGVKAMNWMYNVMPKDGLSMIVPLDNSVVNQLMRPEKMRFDAGKMSWLGSSNQTNIVMVVRTDTGVNKWQDLKNKALVGGASGKSSTGYMMPMLVRGMFGLNFKMVTGYKGSSKTIFSVERGETMMSAYNWLAWSSKVPHWFRGKKPFARPIIQMGVFRDPDLPGDVPMLKELAKTPMDKKAVQFIGVLGLLGRGLAYPPGVSKTTIKVMRTAYDKMNADPTFAATLKKRGLRLMPSTGAQIEKIVKEALNSASPDVVSHARKLIYGGSS